MLRYQRGATLLEAILVSAIMGWVLAYVGTQLKRYAIDKEIDNAVAKIIHINNVSKSYFLAHKLMINSEGDTPEYIPNPLLIQTAVGKILEKDQLKWMELKSCSPPGLIPNNVRVVYFPCNYKADLFSLKMLGINIEYHKFKSVVYPRSKRYVRNASSIFINESNNEIGDFFSIATRISSFKRIDGTLLDDSQIIINEYSKSGRDVFTLVSDTAHPLSDYTEGNISELNKYIKRVTSNGNYAAMTIPIIYENDPSEIYLRTDGLSSMQLNSKLCWDSQTGNKKACIRAVTDDEDRSNFLVVEGGLLFGRENKKRTPVEVSYNTFVNNQDVIKPYLICPYTNAEDVFMLNKIAVFSSSFSSGSESASSFVSSQNIISKGTKGANGKHAMISGLSFEWKGDDLAQQWNISGAIGFDAAYAAENGNSSVLRNPKSMSFIVIQWCEERGA